MEPTSKPITAITLHTTIAKIEEKFETINWCKNALGQTTYNTISLGWFLQFTGSSESIKLFDDDPPAEWQEGADIAITFSLRPNPSKNR